MSIKIPPSKIYYTTEAEYRVHFEETLCRAPIMTFDGIPVRFRNLHFDHCMFESIRRNGIKDKFSPKRAQRMDWIRETLINPDSKPRQGWDTNSNCLNPNRRVTVLYERFVVVIRCWWKCGKKLDAEFVTCFIADDADTIRLILAKPRWQKEKCR